MNMFCYFGEDWCIATEFEGVEFVVNLVGRWRLFFNDSYKYLLDLS